jgi:fumarylacetoacetase
MSTPAPTKSFVEVSAESHFPIQNIPFGVFKTSDGAARCASRIGDTVVDLSVLAEAGHFPDEYKSVFAEGSLNAFMAKGRGAWRDARSRIQALLAADNPTLRDDEALSSKALLPISSVEMQLPATIGDYTDFYSSREHATNVGTMFRGADNALQPNWLHLPVGYHGRASSVVITGTPVRRPRGQLQVDATDPKKGSRYGACRLMDFELEVGTFVGVGNEMGSTISVEEADKHIFGLVLMNDWSARDIQKWEYVPLGPFGAKNFATSISPWIVTLDALAPFKAPTSAGAQTDPEPLPYLRDPDYSSYDIKLNVGIATEGMKEPHNICKSNFKNLYWNVRQQLVHHTVTGCNMRPGDLLGSGTISGSTEDSYGSMLELSWKGSKSLPMPDGSERKFLKDGDNVVMEGFAQGDGFRVGFGVVEGVVLPAHPVEE